MPAAKIESEIFQPLRASRQVPLNTKSRILTRNFVPSWPRTAVVRTMVVGMNSLIRSGWQPACNISRTKNVYSGSLKAGSIVEEEVTFSLEGIFERESDFFVSSPFVDAPNVDETKEALSLDSYRETKTLVPMRKHIIKLRFFIVLIESSSTMDVQDASMGNVWTSMNSTGMMRTKGEMIQRPSVGEDNTGSCGECCRCAKNTIIAHTVIIIFTFSHALSFLLGIYKNTMKHNGQKSKGVVLSYSYFVLYYCRLYPAVFLLPPEFYGTVPGYSGYSMYCTL